MWTRGVTAIVAVLWLTACKHVEQVTASEFERQYAEIHLAQDMRVVTFLGERDGKAFIRVREMSTLSRQSWSERVIYVELAELDPAFRSSLPKKEVADPPGAGR